MHNTLFTQWNLHFSTFLQKMHTFGFIWDPITFGKISLHLTKRVQNGASFCQKIMKYKQKFCQFEAVFPISKLLIVCTPFWWMFKWKNSQNGIKCICNKLNSNQLQWHRKMQRLILCFCSKLTKQNGHINELTLCSFAHKVFIDKNILPQWKVKFSRENMWQAYWQSFFK